MLSFSTGASLCSGLGLACISIGLVIRLLVTFGLVHFGGFNLKEKLFIAVAWLPKATVQVSNRTPGPPGPSATQPITFGWL